MNNCHIKHPDAIVEVFAEVRNSRPPIFQGCEFQTWLAAISQVIAAFPTAARRWAAIVLIADDLARAVPGTPLDLAYGLLEQAVQREQRS